MPSPQQQQSQAPGEFTRMFQAPSQPTPAPVGQPASTPAPAATGRPAKKSNYLPIFIGLGLLLVIAIALILIFALRK
jgi:hypothetical protein